MLQFLQSMLQSARGTLISLPLQTNDSLAVFAGRAGPVSHDQHSFWKTRECRPGRQSQSG